MASLPPSSPASARRRNLGLAAGHFHQPHPVAGRILERGHHGDALNLEAREDERSARGGDLGERAGDVLHADVDQAFYRAIFGWDIGPDGRFTVPAATPLPGNLRVEPAAQGPVAERLIYIGVEDITGTLAQITAAGGSLVFPRLEVQGVAVVAAFKDPAGNRMGLVEMAGGKAKVPPAR